MENLKQLFVDDPARSRFREETLEQARQLFQGSTNWDEAVGYLHDRGLSIPESASVLCELSRMPLGKAKDIITAHPVWANTVRATEPLHDALEKAIPLE